MHYVRGVVLRNGAGMSGTAFEKIAFLLLMGVMIFVASGGGT